ncbi:MAG: TonB family protein [Gammaproteobacteria bacterium]|jgi:protein TonB
MRILRLSHFVAISLALHAAALLVVRHHAPARDWTAGPVIVSLVRPRESGTASSEKVAGGGKTQSVSSTGATTAVKKVQPQRQPARVPATRPAATEKLPDIATPAGPVQQHTAERTATTAALEQQVLDSLRAALMPHFSYPLLARRRGWEGIVRVGVRVEANGDLTRLHLVEPCPYGVLNTAAINSLARLARLPNAGNWLHGGHVDLVLPVEYRLLEG